MGQTTEKTDNASKDTSIDQFENIARIISHRLKTIEAELDLIRGEFSYWTGAWPSVREKIQEQTREQTRLDLSSGEIDHDQKFTTATLKTSDALQGAVDSGLQAPDRAEKPSPENIDDPDQITSLENFYKYNILFERVTLPKNSVYQKEGYDGLATRFKKYIIFDGEFSKLSKKELTKIYGWSLIAIASHIKSNLTEEGRFVLNVNSKKIVHFDKIKARLEQLVADGGMTV